MRGITEILTRAGVMNIGGADVLRVLRNGGRAHLGVGTAAGHDRVRQAALAAITSPLLETSIGGARALVCNIAGATNLGLLEVYEVADLIAQQTHADTDVVFGALIDPSLGNRCRVTVIAAGIDTRTRSPQPQPDPASTIQSHRHTPTSSRGDEPYGSLDVPDFPALRPDAPALPSTGGNDKHPRN